MGDSPYTLGQRDIIIKDLGSIDYQVTWDLQKSIQSELIDYKRGLRDSYVPNALLLLEHPHVFTLGKSGDKENMLVNSEQLKSVGASLVEIDRGGDITYHGPGQLVAYPLLDLDRYTTDIGVYLRKLEEVVIRTCAEWGIIAGRVEGRTGVWVGPDKKGLERKICALGIRCSRWVTMHGLALNVNPNLQYFGLMNPCGITDRGVTSMLNELGRNIKIHKVKNSLAKHFLEVFDSEEFKQVPFESLYQTVDKM